MKFKMLGKDWTITVKSNAAYSRLHGDDSVGVTEAKKKTIHIKAEGLDKDTIAHELVHAHISEMCVDSMTLDFDNFEEFMAEFTVKHAKDILDLSASLMYRLSKEGQRR